MNNLQRTETRQQQERLLAEWHEAYRNYDAAHTAAVEGGDATDIKRCKLAVDMAQGMIKQIERLLEAWQPAGDSEAIT